MTTTRHEEEGDGRTQYHCSPFQPFFEFGYICQRACARPRPPGLLSACLPARTNKLMEAGRPRLVACMGAGGRTDADARPGPVRNRRYPKIQRRRPRRRRHRRPRGSGRPAATTTTVPISGGRFIPCEMISRPFRAWNNILMGRGHNTRYMTHNVT